MKVIKKLSIFLLIILMLTGCDSGKSNMEDISIYTTTYPINFLINNLYQDHCKVYSIYPTGITLDDYELSDRKLEEYSKSDLFIFNSLDKDRDYAVKMINLNSKLKVIDVATGMDYEYAIEELWLNPNNYLMMAENIKSGLSEYIDNPYLVEEIEHNYETLEYEISKLDANLTETIIGGNYDTIVVDNDMFMFLEKHGLNVISLEENEDLSSNKIDEVKSLIENKEIKYIYSATKETNNTVSKLIEEYELERIVLNSMHSIDGGITNSNDNYLTVMTNNINDLKKELYK
ncbi:MAG: zinc ABC transporter substrate-binding protein [Bacilli bacterium]|nr:zinc ABC transporter substrate-binding protein [Bacilli bacterium]